VISEIVETGLGQTIFHPMAEPLPLET